MKALLEGKDPTGPLHRATYTGAGAKMTIDEFNARGRKDKSVGKLCLLITDGAPTDRRTVDDEVRQRKFLFEMT